ncbi:MAG: Tol-Pal system beta propeller repeat protein TolB [Chromatiaceae bacterium]|nr:Tol-Pal system beta propeller repeat protein TolB [Chromatiaceae bacterium]
MQSVPFLSRLLFALVLLLLASGAQARLNIEIRGGTEAAQPIAIVPFGMREGAAPALDVAAVIAADLARTGRFRPLPQRDMLAQPSTREEVDPRDWRLLGVNNLVIGAITPEGQGFRIAFTLYDVFGGSELLASSLSATSAGLRQAAHRIADRIYERLTGQPGVAATRIAYITTEGSGATQTVALRVADADGYNPQTIVASSEPLMSPAWSPDGRRIAYVSFENQRPAIYVQELSSGRRELVASYPGINSSPAFSPDGRRLAMTLSKDGNPDIYVLDLASRTLARLTDHYGIDTEPLFSPDGERLFFTSNRGGSPQIYQMPASGGAAQRVSFEGDYNASASLAPDAQHLAMVSRLNGQFRIALLDLARGATRLLSSGALDESPSFAPNGSMVLYATVEGGRGVLAATAVDGGASQRLSQDGGQVREPAWSPMMP